MRTAFSERRTGCAVCRFDAASRHGRENARPGDGTGAVWCGRCWSGRGGFAIAQAGEREGLLEGLQRPEADGGLRRLAWSEERDGRDAHDPVLHGGLRVRVDVEL